jgi:hypothetical protein
MPPQSFETGEAAVAPTQRPQEALSKASRVRILQRPGSRPEDHPGSARLVQLASGVGWRSSRLRYTKRRLS